MALLGVSSLLADTLLTKRRDADEVPAPGRSSEAFKNQKVEVWIGADRVRRDDGRTALILRLDQRKLYIVNHAKREYVALDLEQKADRWRAITGLPRVPDTEAFLMHAKVEPIAETRKIGSWKTLRYQVALSNETGQADRIRLAWWVAPDLKIEDAPLRTLALVLASMTNSGDEWIATLQSVPGQPVLFERVEKLPEMEVKAREQLVAVERREAPAGTYELPAGHRRIDFHEYLTTFGFPGPL